MKKMNLIVSSLTLVGLLSFAGCNNTSNSNTNSNSGVNSNSTNESTTNSSSQITSVNPDTKHTVTLVLNNGEENKTRSVKHNTMMSEPMAEKLYYENIGWYTDEACELEKWNFGVDKVTKDMTLYAKWEVDYEDWVWRLARIASKSTIMLYVQHYRNYDESTNTYSGLYTSGFGSGVVIYEETLEDGSGYYYALTNNHVVACANEETNNMITGMYSKITVYDHYMNPYSAELLASQNNYDLALVKFSTVADSYTSSPSGGMIHPNVVEEQYDIKVAKFAAENPKEGDHVSSYGSPIAQPHVCTIGTLEFYAGGSIYDNPNSVSNIHEFDVIHHTASILEGNSGGPLFGVDLSLVGINYGSSGSNDTYITSNDFWAVPINNVRDFLDIYVVEVYGDQYAFLGEL